MLRKMTVDDYTEVYQMWDEAQEVGINEQDDTYEGICRFISMNPSLCIVAVEDHMIVGSILASYDGRRGHIYHTIVRSEYRNKGIGHQLVDEVLKELSRSNVSEIDLIAKTSNTIGNTFWENRGFTLRESLNYRRKVME